MQTVSQPDFSGKRKPAFIHSGPLAEAVNRQPALNAANASQLRRMEFVGPQAGEQLPDDGVLAKLFSFLGLNKDDLMERQRNNTLKELP